MEIDRYVTRKWAENANTVKEWGELTPYVSRKVDKTLASAEYGEIYASSTSSYIVTIRPGIGSIPVKYAVQFCNKTVRFSCGYFEDINAPCVHTLLALNYINKLPGMTGYFHDSWKTSVFVDAYSELSENAILPLVLKESLTSDACMSPYISKKRGRPKKKRISSQQATEILES
uniref:SWIM-type domain-containing protein n=1 Tax=Globisporangium ultimum (strain ATCC 200006 / CBS 805.95 / DAOM BR144) TaxID=431595 RepID=K3WMJ6_GLOUD